MQVKKIFNNNSVLVKTDDGKEAVVFGKGIGFMQGQGDRKGVDASKIQKIFYVTDKIDEESYSYLFQNIPANIISTIFDAVNQVKRKYAFPVYDSIYLTLSEHINGAYKLLSTGNYRENQIPDFKLKYPLEYQISADVLQLINRRLKVTFPRSEIRSIALHFINSRIPEVVAKPNEVETEIFNTSKLVNIVTKVLNDNNVFQTANNKNSFRRFLIHLQYLAKRMRHPPKRKDLIDKKIQVDMIKAYPRSFKITQKIFQILKEEFNYKPSDAEETYFIIHIHQIITQ